MLLRKIAYLVLFLVILLPALLLLKPGPRMESPENAGKSVVPLPEPRLKGSMSVEEAIAKRRSIRSYRDEPLTLEEIS
ncbi:hypothetical protein J2747_000590 [Thermococcus stetteri]|nr:hypothetical protein [Thermococcus stetteri]